MPRVLARLSIALVLSVLAGTHADATQSCLKGNKPYKLAGDTVGWSMKIAPGADCIQGLRWSTMQIYGVSVKEQPKNGELVMVGPGFRYFAKPDFNGTDSFTLIVVGKNIHDTGVSTLQISVTGMSDSFAVSSANGPDAKVAAGGAAAN